MKITAKTRISDIIRLNPQAIDVIASINSHFGKLKSPFLRRLLAPRVTVEQAASVGNVSTYTFLQKLQEINFDVEFPKERNREVIEDKMNEPDPTIIFDVRPLLAGGEDPLKQILGKVKVLKPGETLLLINSFQPTPLIRVLANKGCSAKVYRLSDDLVYTYFTLGKEVKEEEEQVVEKAADKFSSVEESFQGRLKEIDVRELEMPKPMMTILDELEKLENNMALFVHHKKVPQFLLPELNDRGFVYVISEVEDDYVKLIIYRE